MFGFFPKQRDFQTSGVPCERPFTRTSAEGNKKSLDHRLGQDARKEGNAGAVVKDTESTEVLGFNHEAHEEREEK